MSDEVNSTSQNSTAPSQGGQANPPSEPLKNKHLPPKIWVTVLVVAALAVAYLGIASAYDIWPFTYVSPTAKDEIGGDEEGVDELAGWQTYRNEEFGFEVKYPGDWTYKPLDDADEGAGIDSAEIDKSIFRIRFLHPKLFRNPQLSHFTIEIVPEKSMFYKADLRAFVQAMDDVNEFGKYQITIEEHNLNIPGADDSFLREEAYQSQLLRIVSFVKKDGYIYLMSVGFASREEVRNLYNQILSTFKFVE